jgi:pyruvate dehydrogenase (quinone)
MTSTAADILIDTIHDWGVDVIFGLPGDGINGIVETLRRRQDKIRFIQVRHEESAAFMACGYAKFTGRLGVCLATSGPGAIHLLNGLYDAKLDGQPVLALTGMPFHDLVSTHTQQDVEADKLFMDVAVYNARVMGPNHVENVTWSGSSRPRRRTDSRFSSRHTISSPPTVDGNSTGPSRPMRWRPRCSLAAED